MLFCFKEAFITRILFWTKDYHTAAWLLSQSDETRRFSPLVIQRSRADRMAALPVLIPSETDQSEVPVLTTESKHGARDTQQLQANESVIDIIFTKLSALTLTSLLCKPL